MKLEGSVIRYLVAFTLALFSLSAGAVDQDTVMDLIQQGGGDGLTITEQLLEIIFQGGTITDQQDGLLGALSRVLNSAVLVYVVASISVGGINYVLHSANKGTMGGGKISSMWVVVRMGTFLPMLIPLSSGYSAAQYIVNGTAHAATYVADEAALVGTRYIADNGTPYPLEVWNTRELLQAAMLSELCVAYFKEEYRAGVVEAQSGGVTADNEAYKVALSWPVKGGENNFCGSFRVARGVEPNIDTDSPYDSALQDYYASEVDALVKLRMDAQQIVEQYYMVNGSLREWQREQERRANRGEAKTGDAPAKAEVDIGGAANAMRDATENYDARMRQAATRFVSSVNMTNTNGKTEWEAELEEKGFAVLGTYYFSMLKMQQFVRQALISNTEHSPPTYNNGRTDYSKDIGKDREFFSEAFLAMAETSKSLKSDSELGEIHALDSVDLNSGISGFFGDFLSAITQQFIVGVYNVIGTENINDESGEAAARDNVDLVVMMQSLGSALVTIGELVVVGVLIFFAAGKSTAAGIEGSILSFSGANIISGLINFIIDVALTFVVPVIIYLIGLGLFLMYWLPAIPVITWIMAYYGWLIIYFSALIIIPPWLGTLVVATGDDWVSSHSRQGWVLLFGLFARPTFMVIIFFAIYILMRLAGYLLMWFMEYILSITATGFAGFLSMVMILTVVSIFAYNLVTRTFALLPELPDRIMRGLNAGHDTFGEQESEMKGRGAAFGAGAAMMAGGSKQMDARSKRMEAAAKGSMPSAAAGGGSPASTGEGA